MTIDDSSKEPQPSNEFQRIDVSSARPTHDTKLVLRDVLQFYRWSHLPLLTSTTTDMFAVKTLEERRTRLMQLQNIKCSTVTCPTTIPEPFGFLPLGRPSTLILVSRRHPNVHTH
jgi:hypothetical protein